MRYRSSLRPTRSYSIFSFQSTSSTTSSPSWCPEPQKHQRDELHHNANPLISNRFFIIGGPPVKINGTFFLRLQHRQPQDGDPGDQLEGVLALPNAGLPTIRTPTPMMSISTTMNCRRCASLSSSSLVTLSINTEVTSLLLRSGIPYLQFHPMRYSGTVRFVLQPKQTNVGTQNTDYALVFLFWQGVEVCTLIAKNLTLWDGGNHVARYNKSQFLILWVIDFRDGFKPDMPLIQSYTLSFMILNVLPS